MDGAVTAFKTFESAFTAGKSQLVMRWVPADLETPVSAYLKLCHEQPYSFLLESVEGGAFLGRYSAIGFAPDLVWSYPGDDSKPENPFDTLRRHVRGSRLDDVPTDAPPMAASGLFGYLGYGMVKLVEDIPDDNPDPVGIPDAVMIRPTIMVIFDNVKNMMCLATPVRMHQNNTEQTARQVYTEALGRLSDTMDKLTAPLPAAAINPVSTLSAPLAAQSDTSEEDYKQAVRKAVDYIHAGDIFQVVPSLRFKVPFDLPAFSLYRSLRRINPSPFLFHLNFGDFALVGSSPEIMVRVRGEHITIRPIAGTRKRGATPQDDKALAADLLADEKERAEHLMLLDLGRNDVGRVAEIGTVNVTEQFTVEHYSHVMHIVSNIEGTLSRDCDSLDALCAGFPAGTVSGAPKIRAMEIIDELEPLRRSFYAGCIGYLDGRGDVDTCIALRTALVKDGMMYVQAGAGIVADSDPAAEYKECCNKARALIDAAEQAVTAHQPQADQPSSQDRWKTAS